MTPRKSLGDLLAETPQMIVDLAKAEVQHLKEELSEKAKGVGIGGALLAAAAVVAIFLFSWLIYAGYQGLNVVFEPWLSALIVSFIRTNAAFSGFATVIGTVLGFVAGAYIPVGSLPPAASARAPRRSGASRSRAALARRCSARSRAVR